MDIVYWTGSLKVVQVLVLKNSILAALFERVTSRARQVENPEEVSQIQT